MLAVRREGPEFMFCSLAAAISASSGWPMGSAGASHFQNVLDADPRVGGQTWAARVTLSARPKAAGS